jgi:hypothetical protein
MVFKDRDNGPWWMLSEEGRSARQHDIHAPSDEVNSTRLANRTELHWNPFVPLTRSKKSPFDTASIHSIARFASDCRLAWKMNRITCPEIMNPKTTTILKSVAQGNQAIDEKVQDTLLCH